MKVFGLVLALLAPPAPAQTVTINGETHGTGYLRKPKDAPKTFFSPFSAAETAELAAALPENYNGDAEGFGTRVKNQGQCGSCSFFARVASFESALLKAGYFNASTLDLSEQDHMMNDNGSYKCEGGFMDGDWLTAHSVAPESRCPYTGSSNRSADRCTATDAERVQPKPGRWVQMGTSSRAPTMDEMKVAIHTYGALAVTVAAGGLNPGSDGRVSGSSCNARGINHMVTAVGWVGNELLVRNSWGTSWGKAGYFIAKPGCTQLASDPGDAAMYYVVEGTPEPQPAPLEGLAEEYVAAKGNPIMVQVKPSAVAGFKYRWQVGGGPVLSGARITVTTTTATTATLKVTDPSGAVTEKTVKISIK